MFSTDDTIVAIATPPGRGAIGVVRLSGPDAPRIAAAMLNRAAPLAPRRATLARVDTIDGRALDRVIATYFPAPRSYTAQHVIELSAHGSPLVLQLLVKTAMSHGARLAAPGEFTLRAFLAGRIDLVQAEAVADLINAVTPLEARAAFDQLEGTLTTAIAAIDARLFDLCARLEASLDFPDEGYHFVTPAAARGELDAIAADLDALVEEAARGRLVREGAQVAIAGRPNVGKSTMFNRLLGAARAIVTDVPGTTRDMLTEVVEIEGIRVTLVDTAGIRPVADVVESEGVARARRAIEVADLVLLVLDRSRALDDEDAALLESTRHRPRLVIVNKADLAAAWDTDAIAASAASFLVVSLARGDGLDALPRAIARALGAASSTPGEPLRDSPAITNVRHIDLLERAARSLAHARAAIAASGGALSEEFVLADLQDARAAFEEITGRRTTDDLLAYIFSRFCIGK